MRKYESLWGVVLTINYRNYMHFPFINSFTKLGIHKHPIDKIAELNGLFSGIALYPQVIKLIITKNTGDLSIYTFLFIFLNSIIWVIYARHRSLPQVLLSSLLNCIAAGFIVTLILLKF